MSSIASRVSLMMINVWPMIVTELIGPVYGDVTYEYLLYILFSSTNHIDLCA
jgi:hypothetical protein